MDKVNNNFWDKEKYPGLSEAEIDELQNPNSKAVPNTDSEGVDYRTDVTDPNDRFIGTVGNPKSDNQT